MTENNASQWASFADGGGSTSVTNSTNHVTTGSYSLEFITGGGFATGVSYPASNDANWNLESNILNFSFYAINTNTFGFQEPVKVKLYSGTDYFLYSFSTVPVTETFYQYSIPLDEPNCNWIKTSQGNPSLTNITSVEFIWDTWDFGFTVYLDGVDFISDNSNNGVDVTNRYNELKNLIVILRSHDGNQLTSSQNEIETIADQVSLFYWKHSKHNLSLKWDFLEIPENVILWGSGGASQGIFDPALASQLLIQYGITNNQYDVIAMLSPNGGNWGWTSGNILLGKSGFTHMSWNHTLASKYWVFTHEFNHVVDGLMNSSGYNVYPHNHPGSARTNGEYIPPSGPDFDLNAQFMLVQEASRWHDLAYCGSWGIIKNYTDIDSDGFADNDPTLPIDELRFGSSPNKTDTDGDGLSDIEEHYAGMQISTDPNVQDTDGDGILDGFDKQPLYGFPYVIPMTTVNPGSINFGDYHLIGEQNGADIYASFDANYLHLAIDNNPYSGGRYDLHFDFGDSFNSLRVRDAVNSGGSDYLDLPLNINSIIVNTMNAGNQIYLSIPVSSDYDYNSDLGQTIGFRMNGTTVRQTVFEWDDYLELTLGEHCSDWLRISSFPFDPYVYQVNEFITSNGFIQNSPSGIHLRAGQYVLLEEQFEVTQGSVLDVNIVSCP